VGAFKQLDSSLEDTEVLLEMVVAEEAGADELGEVMGSFETIDSACHKLETQRLLGNEGDEHSAILEINSGAGGTDASDWAEMLKRMYLRWAEREGYSAKIVDEQAHPEAGIKHCAMEIKGRYAYGYLKGEIGVHRLVRISPFDANARRHTAFASVAAYPDVEDDIEIDINPSDLRIDTYRSSGAGGQHVNTTDSAVRIVHNPTGIVVQCQNERSQHKNKATAMKMLKARLYQHELSKRQEAATENRSSQKAIEWGSQIRNYVLHPYRMVKDTRTGEESGDVDGFLDGNLTLFMESWLGYMAGLDEEGQA
jgi:peptide chain release factor 2